MVVMHLSNAQIEEFARHLCREEKSAATREKYVRDVRKFYGFSKETPITKELVISWKKALMEQGYAVRSVNSMLASVNLSLIHI